MNDFLEVSICPNYYMYCFQDLAKKIERDSTVQAIIREAAVRAKIQLSSEMAVNISIPILSGGKNLTVELTRSGP